MARIGGRIFREGGTCRTSTVCVSDCMLIRPITAFTPLLVLACAAAPVFADGGFYGDPPDETHPWAIHDMNRPQPPLVTPGTFSTARSETAKIAEG